jgi:biotin carboxyl carrier protein
MLPDKDGYIRIRANVAGEVDIRAKIGQLAYSGQILAVVEGDLEIESLSIRRPSKVVEVLVDDGSEVPSGTVLMVVRELTE